MLEIVKLERRFNNGSRAFRPIDVTINKGDVVGILGTSGCGKSTFLRVLAGLDPIDKGEIILDGQHVIGLHPAINLVFQEPRLLPWKRVFENVAFGLPDNNKHSQEEIRELVNGALEKVGLTNFTKHFPKELSGGMAQRVALARALVRTPEVLLLDEPFSALDAFIRMNLQDLLLEIQKQTRATILLVTHDIDEALYLCNRVLVLRGQPGRLVRDIHVDIPHPRHRGDLDLAKLKESVIADLDLATAGPDPEIEYLI